MSIETKSAPTGESTEVLETEDDGVVLVAPERQVPDLELPDWQNGYWPSSKNVTQ